MPTVEAIMSSIMLRYFTLIHERDGSTYSTAGSSDGDMLYRAIARQEIGDPTEEQAIKEAVLYWVLHVRSNREHPQRDWYFACEQSFYKATRSELFSALHGPDLAGRLPEVVEVIGQALNIQLTVVNNYTATGKASGFVYCGGSMGGTPCLVLQRPSLSRNSFLYSSLIPDTSGKALVERLQMLKAENHGGLHMRQIGWAHAEDEAGVPSFAQYNEWRFQSPFAPLSLRNPLNRLDVFKVVVNFPRQIRPAIELLKHVLDLAPNQRERAKVTPMCTVHKDS
ncbi:hypothetical protein CLAFUW4_09872 [Fulvia fulva]|uniref:Uncharacterized protein n=1 Tax=Passalora fulva TaxID=5499 RepID=A0A9Q8PIZ5_PASFU|nr:uncharacterized protein CLAFUR5_12367 [Fulvia fulva]KAK4616875.1 hypothetical protein CLAFUR0_09871 [Fulvia fulva]UJO23267.1 hypothetical protein CLAFUR5_12367 [Fulvia fulva]WPV18721.1 hypothetical protein CLAFUW4_09872 [Fulvia fulva]